MLTLQSLIPARADVPGTGGQTPTLPPLHPFREGKGSRLLAGASEPSLVTLRPAGRPGDGGERQTSGDPPLSLQTASGRNTW